MTVPPGAISAAQVHDYAVKDGDWTRVPDAQVRRLLEGAAPLIAAAERDRIRQLAEEHNAVADPCYDEQPFADLLRGDQP